MSIYYANIHAPVFQEFLFSNSSLNLTDLHIYGVSTHLVYRIYIWVVDAKNDETTLFVF